MYFILLFNFKGIESFEVRVRLELGFFPDHYVLKD